MRCPIRVKAEPHEVICSQSQIAGTETVTYHIHPHCQGISDPTFTKSLADVWHEGTPIRNLEKGVLFSSEEAAAAASILKSRLWRHVRDTKGRNLVVCFRSEREALEESSDRLELLTIEDLIHESRMLDFDRMQSETLSNIVSEYKRSRKPISMSLLWDIGNKSEFLIRYDDYVDPGLAYCAPADVAPYIYAALKDQELIEFTRSGIRPTHRGIASTIGRGRSGPSDRRVFVVMKYDRPDREELENMYQRISESLQLHIGPVWSFEHNDRIDDRILLSIRDCLAVIVDIDRKNFNVGFETGYAMALGKPIIPIQQGKVKMPFDIWAYPCIEYSEDKGELRKRLEARLRLVIGAFDE